VPTWTDTTNTVPDFASLVYGNATSTGSSGTATGTGSSLQGLLAQALALANAGNVQAAVQMLQGLSFGSYGATGSVPTGYDPNGNPTGFWPTVGGQPIPAGTQGDFPDPQNPGYTLRWNPQTNSWAQVSTAAEAQNDLAQQESANAAVTQGEGEPNPGYLRSVPTGWTQEQWDAATKPAATPTLTAGPGPETITPVAVPGREPPAKGQTDYKSDAGTSQTINPANPGRGLPAPYTPPAPTAATTPSLYQQVVSATVNPATGAPDTPAALQTQLNNSGVQAQADLIKNRPAGSQWGTNLGPDGKPVVTPAPTAVNAAASAINSVQSQTATPVVKQAGTDLTTLKRNLAGLSNLKGEDTTQTVSVARRRT